MLVKDEKKPVRNQEMLVKDEKEPVRNQEKLVKDEEMLVGNEKKLVKDEKQLGHFLIQELNSSSLLRLAGGDLAVH